MALLAVRVMGGGAAATAARLGWRVDPTFEFILAAPTHRHERASALHTAYPDRLHDLVAALRASPSTDNHSLADRLAVGVGAATPTPEHRTLLTCMGIALATGGSTLKELSAVMQSTPSEVDQEQGPAPAPQATAPLVRLSRPTPRVREVALFGLQLDPPAEVARRWREAVRTGAALEQDPEGMLDLMVEDVSSHWHRSLTKAQVRAPSSGAQLPPTLSVGILTSTAMAATELLRRWEMVVLHPLQAVGATLG